MRERVNQGNSSQLSRSAIIFLTGTMNAMNTGASTSAVRPSRQLAARAQKAEDWTTMTIAETGIDDAERMILEPISARLDAEPVGHG